MMTIVWNARQLMQLTEANARRNLTKAAIHLVNAVKVTLSVPAPRRRANSMHGHIYYVATTPAIPGAPPRKLSGRLRSSITYEVLPTAPDGSITARVGTNVVYGRVHEVGNHKYLVPTLQQERGKLGRIIATGQA